MNSLSPPKHLENSSRTDVERRQIESATSCNRRFAQQLTATRQRGPTRRELLARGSRLTLAHFPREQLEAVSKQGGRGLPPSRNDGKTRLSRSFTLPKTSFEMPTGHVPRWIHWHPFPFLPCCCDTGAQSSRGQRPWRIRYRSQAKVVTTLEVPSPRGEDCVSRFAAAASGLRTRTKNARSSRAS